MKHLQSFEDLFENTNSIKLVGNELPTKNMKSNLAKIEATIDFVTKMFGEQGNQPLKTFLKEIAMAETHLGTANGTIRTGGNAGRGPWQIDKITFDDSKVVSTRPQMKKYIVAMKNHGIDWVNLNWNDCNKILFSCINARLLFALREFKLSPEKISSRVLRANIWKKLYNTVAGKGTPQSFWEKVKQCLHKLGIQDHYSPYTYDDAKQKGLNDALKVSEPKTPKILNGENPTTVRQDNTSVNKEKPLLDTDFQQ